MTLDKLQMIATAIAAPAQKVRWLQQWNSSSMTREVLHFPAKGFTEKDFEPWLNRASFWAGVRDHCPRVLSDASSAADLPFNDL